jgi:AraC-like DNA-binding protein
MISAILYIGIAQCFFAAVLVLTKKKKLSPDRMLLWWLVTIGVKFILYLLNQEHREFFNINFSAGLIPLTFGPFLYLYTKFLTNEENYFKPKHLLHFLPFFLMTIVYFMFFNEIVSFTEDQYLKQDSMLWVRILYAMTYFTSILVYTLLTFLSLRRYRREIQNTLSYNTVKTRLYWLNYLAILFALTFFIYFLCGFTNAVMFAKVYDGNLVSSVGLTLLAFSVSFFGLRQPALFRSISQNNDNLSEISNSNYVDTIIDNVGKGTVAKETEVQLPANNVLVEEENLSDLNESNTEEEIDEQADNLDETTIKQEDKYKKSSLKESEVNKIIESLEKYMKDERPYLNAELTILDLSNKLNVSKHHLTQVLNFHIGKNFFTYINEYRITAVKNKIEDPKYDHLTLLAIAFECGFNSKSSFNNIFKQYTGYTPSEYKKINVVNPE